MILHDELLPITCTDYDTNGDVGNSIMLGATFKEDFGPFKKDEYWTSLEVDASIGKLIGYNEHGEQVKACKIKLISLEE